MVVVVPPVFSPTQQEAAFFSPHSSRSRVIQAWAPRSRSRLGSSQRVIFFGMQASVRVAGEGLGGGGHWGQRLKWIRTE